MTVSPSDKDRQAQQQRADLMLAQRTARAIEQARVRADQGDIVNVNEITERIRTLLGSDAISHDARSQMQAVLRALEAHAYDRAAELALQTAFDAPRDQRPKLMDEFNTVLRQAVIHGAGDDLQEMARQKADEVIARALRTAKTSAEAGDLATVEDLVVKLRDLLAQPIVSESRLGAYTTAVNQFEEVARRKSGDRETAQRAAVAGWEAVAATAGSQDKDIRSKAVSDYRTLLNRAIDLGAPDEFKSMLLKKLAAAVGAAIVDARAQAMLGQVEATEYILAWVRELAALPLVPSPKRGELALTLKGIERDAYMKATDLALEGAFGAAHRNDTAIRNELIGNTKRYLSRAIALGADQEFRDLTDKKIEAVPLTGREKNEGPTRAKPEEEVAKPYNAAKADKRNYRRYARPVFSVRLYGHPCSTVDWSLDGMQLEGYTGDLMAGQMVPVVFGLPELPAHETMVRIIRVDPEKVRLMVQFSDLPARTMGFLRAVIKSRSQNPS